MRRILIGVSMSLALVLGLTAEADAKPKPKPTPPPAGCLATDPGLQTGEGDLVSYTPNVTDPGVTVGGVVVTPPTYSGGDFNFTLDLQGPSCTNGTYAVFVSREDTGETVAFTATGDNSDPIDLTHGPQAIFDGDNNQCVLAHATISVNGQLVHVGPQYEVCATGGGGRTW